MAVVWENGRVAVTKDLVFDLCVMGEQGWVPVSQLGLDDLKMVERLIDHNPSFPFKEELAKAIANAEREAIEAWGK